LRAFATLFVVFWRGRGKRKGKDGAGFFGFPPLPQEQEHGKDRARGFSSDRDDFSDIFLHGIFLPD